jgi:hypothetical protein
MASFAKLNLENIVEQVIVVNNNELLDNGIESEAKGISFCKSLYGKDTNWKQTSYNTKNGKHYLSDNSGLSNTQEKAFRKNHAGIGYTYDENRDAFIPPKPFNSWILNENTCYWEAPVAMPTTELEANQYYSWNEQTLSWDLLDNS